MSAAARAFKEGGGWGEESLVEVVRASGLGRRHVPVLLVLVVNGPLPVGMIARQLALRPATVSQLTGELERAGFVRRRPDEADRRRVIVSLHGPHRALVERFARARLEPVRMTLAALSDVERAHFLHGWRVLVEMQRRFAAAAEAEGEGEAGSSGTMER
ncbi:MarR family winged helix-turn-helix transcriptional regulator [Actinomadura viridis]|uniref:MarR family winged helix-turn-helix transcriptional regulator n=1 Tax=Actinomadura viridis TaxID=58110 RepID=UPI00367416D3